jgi:CspA family cold shock protein
MAMPVGPCGAPSNTCPLNDADGGRLAVRGSPTLGRVIPTTLLCLVVMANGKVDFFNDTGGYGFISTDSDEVDDDEDVFFHMEDVGGPDLEEGQEVEFDIESSPKGPRATNLTRVE